MESNAQPEQNQAGPDTTGFIIAPMAAAAALDSSAFSRVNASEAIPATWEERARKAWEYYVEEPLVKNCVNSWRTFAVGDEIKEEATDAAYRLSLSQFIKDMILQLLFKGDAVGFKRYAQSGRDIEELVCVNPVSVKVKYAQGKGTDDIVRDLGHVVIYKNSFRQAGTRVFSKAQYRMEMIARTEVLRAHNMGQLKFHQQVGIQKLEWMTMAVTSRTPTAQTEKMTTKDKSPV